MKTDDLRQIMRFGGLIMRFGGFVIESFPDRFAAALIRTALDAADRQGKPEPESAHLRARLPIHEERIAALERKWLNR